MSVYFNIRNTLPKSGTFLLGHSVYTFIAFSVRYVSTFAFDVWLYELQGRLQD